MDSANHGKWHILRALDSKDVVDRKMIEGKKRKVDGDI
jgi:hypothetical protein